MKKVLTILLAILMVMTLAGCGQKTEEEATPAEPEAETKTTTLDVEPLAEEQYLSIGFFAGSPHGIPFYVADKMGFFAEANVKVDADSYKSFTGGPAMMEASADWDICDVGGPGVLNGMKNKDIHLIGTCDNERNTALFVRADSDLAKDAANPEAWKGKEVLLNKGTTLQYMFLSYMKSIGIEDLDAYNITITDTAVGNCLTAFTQGTGDAMCVWNAFALAADDAGFLRVTDMDMMKLNNFCGLCATADAITNKTELVAKAWEIYYKTVDWMRASTENMDKAVELFLDSAEEEGVALTEANAAAMLKNKFWCPSFTEAVAQMTTMEADRNGSGAQVSQAGNLLFETLDFFISVGNYTEEDRANIVSKGLIDDTIAKLYK